MSDYLLETRQLELAYGPFKAVAGVDLKVRAGTIHTIIGPNGAGKTSLFHCLTGERQATGHRGWAGEVERLRAADWHASITDGRIERADRQVSGAEHRLQGLERQRPVAAPLLDLGVDAAGGNDVAREEQRRDGLDRRCRR